MLVACSQPDTRFKPLGEQLLLMGQTGLIYGALYAGCCMVVLMVLTGMSIMSVTYWQLQCIGKHLLAAFTGTKLCLRELGTADSSCILHCTETGALKQAKADMQSELFAI